MSSFDFRGGGYRRVLTYWRDYGNRISRGKLLGVTFDKNLDVKSHANAICKKAGQKLHSLAHISSYMNVEKLRILMNTFVMS